jgi:hypothetical protein
MAGKLSALRYCPVLSPGRLLVLISVRGWVNPKAIVRLEGCKLKKSNDLIGIRTCGLPACSIVEVEVTLRLMVSQSVSQYALVSGTPLGPMTRFYFFLPFPQNCFAVRLGAPSLTRERVCNLQCNLSVVTVRRTHNHTLLSFETTAFPFRHLLRLTGITVEVFLPASTRGCSIVPQQTTLSRRHPPSSIYWINLIPQKNTFL